LDSKKENSKNRVNKRLNFRKLLIGTGTDRLWVIGLAVVGILYSTLTA
jgi:hypothetical protein